MKKPFYLLIILLFPLYSFAQNSLEFTAAVGATVIDIEELVEIDEIDGTWATDWGTFNSGISAQYIIGFTDLLGFGAELMYQDLYWYSVSVPYGTQRIYREYSVSSVRITPILRLGVNNNFSVDLGPELNFMDGMNLGFLISTNYYIPISDKIDIPIKLRTDFVNHIVKLYPISFNTGIRIKM